MKNPLDIIKKHFEFLVNEYSYQISNEEFSPQSMGNAYITYISTSISLQISIDRSQVLLNIGETSDNMKDWFDFTDVVAFFNPSVQDTYIFTKKTKENSTDDIIEAQASRLASLLRENCAPILKGELWMKEKIRDIEKVRVAEMIKSLNRNKPK